MHGVHPCGGVSASARPSRRSNPQVTFFFCSGIHVSSTDDNCNQPNNERKTVNIIPRKTRYIGVCVTSYAPSLLPGHPSENVPVLERLSPWLHQCWRHLTQATTHTLKDKSGTPTHANQTKREIEAFAPPTGQHNSNGHKKKKKKKKIGTTSILLRTSLEAGGSCSAVCGHKAVAALL